jgi:circadian clock protein KaiB
MTRTAKRSRPAPPGSPRLPALSSSAATRSMQRRVKALRKDDGTGRFLLRLYVTGTTPASVRAIERVQALCEEHLRGRYDLEVVDIYQLPALAKDDQIIATPTLIKVLPAPLRRFIGDLTRAENVIFGMDLRARR